MPKGVAVPYVKRLEKLLLYYGQFGIIEILRFFILIGITYLRLLNKLGIHIVLHCCTIRLLTYIQEHIAGKKVAE